MEQPATQRVRPDVCGPAMGQAGWVIGFALTECITLGLGGLAVWGGVQQRTWWQVLFGVGLVAMGLLQAVLAPKEVRAEIARVRARASWLERAIVRRGIILSRTCEYNDYAESQEEQWDCHLRLVVEVAPSTGQVVQVAVSHRVYRALAHKSAAQLHCDPADPLTFLLEGE